MSGCRAALNIAGQHYPCDMLCVDRDGNPTTGHEGLTHGNMDARAIWTCEGEATGAVADRGVVMEQVFNTGNLPEVGWSTYRKTALTRAIKIDGPFVVETYEGPLRCADGYLAVDARGYPYPIATDEFHMIYEAADAQS